MKSVMAISAGLYHSVCLNSLGQSFIWGRTYTDCDEIQCYNEPTLVDIRESTNDNLKSFRIESCELWRISYSIPNIIRCSLLYGGQSIRPARLDFQQ